jgi:hypothetical protein
MEPVMPAPTAQGPAPQYDRACCSGGGSRGSRFTVGLVLIGLGVLFGLAALGTFNIDPLWRLWPVLLIIAGMSSIVRGRSRGAGGFILLFLGAWFLLRNFGMLPLPHRLFPASILVVVGLGFVVASLVWRRNRWS